MVFCITTGIAAEKSYAIENDQQQLFRRPLGVASAHKARAQLHPPEQIALEVRHTDQPVHPGQDVRPLECLDRLVHRVPAALGTHPSFDGHVVPSQPEGMTVFGLGSGAPERR
jgi:hypothetical protein